jgi:hypothetical protein
VILRRHLFVPALLAGLLAIACTPGAHREAGSPATKASNFHVGPLTDFVPAAGLRWMAVARLGELAHTESLRPSLDLLFPAARLDAFTIATGLDLREAPSALVAGFDYATLYAAETPSESALIEQRFRDRLVLGAREESRHPGLVRISGAIGSTPETLVRLDGRFVAVSVGDPTPARVVELFVLGRLGKSPPALRGSALSTLPPDLEKAPLRFYAPGPFSDEWARGARGLLGAALAFGVAVWPENENVKVRAVLAGRWTGEDATRLVSAWSDLADSTMGKLFGLDQPASEPQVSLRPELLTFEVRLPLAPLAHGLRAAVAADVWEFLRIPPPHDASRPGTTSSLGVSSGG